MDNQILLRTGGNHVEETFLRLVAQAKGRIVVEKSGTSSLEIFDETLKVPIKGIWPSIAYLDERYPDPPLLPSGVAERAMFRSTVECLIYGDPDERAPLLAQLAEYWCSAHESGQTFLYGKKPTILDLALASLPPSKITQPFEDLIDETKHWVEERVRKTVREANRAWTPSADEYDDLFDEEFFDEA